MNRMQCGVMVIGVMHFAWPRVLWPGVHMIRVQAFVTDKPRQGQVSTLGSLKSLVSLAHSGSVHAANQVHATHEVQPVD